MTDKKMYEFYLKAKAIHSDLLYIKIGDYQNEFDEIELVFHWAWLDPSKTYTKEQMEMTYGMSQMEFIEDSPTDLFFDEVSQYLLDCLDSGNPVKPGRYSEVVILDSEVANG